jgi:hypothetical protein
MSLAPKEGLAIRCIPPTRRLRKDFCPVRSGEETDSSLEAIAFFGLKMALWNQRPIPSSALQDPGGDMF